MAANAELRAVFDIDSSINRTVARQHHAGPADSLDSLLAPDVQVVYIATPADLHNVQAVRCAEAG